MSSSTTSPFLDFALMWKRVENPVSQSRWRRMETDNGRRVKFGYDYMAHQNCVREFSEYTSRTEESFRSSKNSSFSSSGCCSLMQNVTDFDEEEDKGLYASLPVRSAMYAKQNSKTTVVRCLKPEFSFVILREIYDSESLLLPVILGTISAGWRAQGCQLCFYELLRFWNSSPFGALVFLIQKGQKNLPCSGFFSVGKSIIQPDGRQLKLRYSLVPVAQELLDSTRATPPAGRTRCKTWSGEKVTPDRCRLA